MSSDIKEYVILLRTDLGDYPQIYKVKKTSANLEVLRGITQVGRTYRNISRDNYVATEIEGHTYTNTSGDKVHGLIYRLRPNA